MNPAKRDQVHVWVLAAVLAATFLAASSQSFWIDEAITAHFSVQPTFHGWVNMMQTERGGSDPQMPFYLFWTWLWEKFFGHGELALRLADWPWLAAGIALFGWRRPAYAMACGLSAFIWYYADEARPYAMQAGLALALMRAAMTLAEGKLERREEFFWQGVLIVSGTLLAMSHLLGMFWTAAYWGFCVIAVRSLRRGEVLKKTAWGWGAALALLGGTTYYYLWTLRSGLRATDAGVTDLRNVFYDLYELMGFSGLGPGRLDIRDLGLVAFKPYAPQLLVAAMVVMPLLGLGGVMLLRRLGLKKAAVFLAAMGGATLFILAVGVEKHFRVLARHLTPLLPVILWLLAAGAERLWQQHGRRGRAIVIAAAVLGLVSCLEIRFAPRHAKDDYRSAAAVANAALKQHQVVWWNADYNGAWYYGVPLGGLNELAPEQALRVINPLAGTLDRFPRPDVIISTKPDLYDGYGYIRNYAVTNGYKMAQSYMAFQVWEK